MTPADLPVWQGGMAAARVGRIDGMLPSTESQVT
jgi:hypothetical protein